MDGCSVQSGCFLGERGAFGRNFTQEFVAASWIAGAYVIGHGSDGRGDVSDQFDLRTVVIVDIRREHVDMNQIPLLPAVPEAGFEFNRVVADGNYQVGCVQDSVRGLCSK